MFGMPSLQNIMIIAITPILIAFAIVNYKENIYSVVTWFVVLISDLLVLSGYFPFIYKSLYGDEEPPKQTKPQKDDQPIYADYENIPQIRVAGKPIYSQNMTGLKIDCIRLFNRTLIDQRRGNLDVRMDETFWLKKTDGQENTRWTQIGGDGPSSFRDMLRSGVKFGAYKEIGGQGKRVPADWQKIRRLERGEPLTQ